MQNSAGGAYLREQGIYSSRITEWRKLRDAGVLAGKKLGDKIGRLTPEQAEIARLRRKLEATERRLARTEVVLTIMGKGLSISWPLNTSRNVRLSARRLPRVEAQALILDRIGHKASLLSCRMPGCD